MEVLCERPMTLKLVRESPRIVLVEGFLSPSECRDLIELGEPKLRRSTVQGAGDAGAKGTNVVSRERTSWTANLDQGQTDLVRRIEKRAALLSGYPLENLEPLQIVRYESGQQYKRHWDYFVRGTEGADDALKRGGQRRVTIFAYLNDVEEGGETHFTDIDLKVSPKAGSAVLFHDCTPDGKEDPRTAHAGTPPTRGTKYGCNIWIREGPFK
jgi:prolyl 4-hydroxylase